MIQPFDQNPVTVSIKPDQEAESSPVREVPTLMMFADGALQAEQVECL
jgi:hypothetical protein